MKPIYRQHLVATLFPASMLDAIKEQSKTPYAESDGEIVFVTGEQAATGRRIRLIAEEYVRAGKTIRIVRTL